MTRLDRRDERRARKLVREWDPCLMLDEERRPLVALIAAALKREREEAVASCELRPFVTYEAKRTPFIAKDRKAKR
jgi:hypothetical protein